MAQPGPCLRALQINEIVRMICEEVDAQSWRSVHRDTPSLARTSKLFMEPALDVIWSELSTLVPLVKCMPETAWEERGQSYQKTIVLRRPIVSTDLPRLLFYSVRVRSLDFDMRFSFSRCGTVHPEVLQALNMSLASQSFMPKISSLRWTPGKDAMTFSHRVLGSNIRTLNVGLDQSKSSLSLLPCVRASCPLVLNFTLSFASAVNQSTLCLITDVVCGWHHLQELSIPNLDLPGFKHISRLPSLTKLNLFHVAVAESGPTHLQEFLSGPTFPSLKYLSIACDAPSFCNDFVQTISSGQLESLSITLLKNWTAIAWKELFTTLRDCLDVNSLIEIEIDQADDSVRPPNAAQTAQYTLSADTFRPLLAFTNLIRVTYQVYPGLSVDDDFLAEIAIAWPEIVDLELVSEVITTEPPAATLSCLIPFARHCPTLTTLGIRMSTSQIPEFTQVAGDRINHSLDALNVGTSPIGRDSEEMGKIAAFLSNLFPKLQSLNTCGDTPDTEPLSTYAKLWSRAWDLVPVFSSVRSEERDFWTEELAESSEAETEDGASTHSNSEEQTL